MRESRYIYTHAGTLLRPRGKNEWNKWKNHFSEMKGDVGMPPHEKEGKQEETQFQL